jgi:hypothetical protein
MKLPRVYADALARLETEVAAIHADTWRDWDAYIETPPGTVFKFGKIRSVIQIAPSARPVALWETY